MNLKGDRDNGPKYVVLIDEVAGYFTPYREES